MEFALLLAMGVGLVVGATLGFLLAAVLAAGAWADSHMPEV